MSQVDLDPTLRESRTGWTLDDPMAVLIAVPEVAAPRIRPARVPTAMPRPTGRRRPRRRLRRPVRVAAWSLLVLVPLVGSVGASWSNWSSRAIGRPIAVTMAGTREDDDRAGALALRQSRPADRSSAGARGRLPVVVLSIESVAGAPAADAEVPIVFPGYVLPDDSLEEPAHEGS
jgi:hypothetical protein